MCNDFKAGLTDCFACQIRCKPSYYNRNWAKINERRVRRRLNEAGAKYNQPFSKSIEWKVLNGRKFTKIWTETKWSSSTRQPFVEIIVLELICKKKGRANCQAPNVCSCFSSKKFGRIVCFKQNVNAELVRDIYKRDLLPRVFHGSKFSNPSSTRLDIRPD